MPNFFQLRDILTEKTLTPAEKRKREEVAKAIKRENPSMPMAKKMAIATATAKKVAEESEQINEYDVARGRDGHYYDDEGNRTTAGHAQRVARNRYKKPVEKLRHYHDVPYKDREAAKKEGMKFDSNKKKWYHPSIPGSNSSQFKHVKTELVREEVSEAKIIVGQSWYGKQEKTPEEKEALDKKREEIRKLNSFLGKPKPGTRLSKPSKHSSLNVPKPSDSVKEEAENVEEADNLALRKLHTANPQSIPNYMRSTEKGKKSLADKNRPVLKDLIKRQLGRHPKANLPEEVEPVEEASYQGKGNHKPGWMLKADPKLAQKFKAKETAVNTLAKYAGKTSDEIAKMLKK